jgi:hypothetical protein
MAIKTLDRLTPDGQVYYDSEMQITEAFVNPGPWRPSTEQSRQGLFQSFCDRIRACMSAGYGSLDEPLPLLGNYDRESI